MGSPCTLDRLPRAFHASHLVLLIKSSIPGLGTLQGPSVAYERRGAVTGQTHMQTGALNSWDPYSAHRRDCAFPSQVVSQGTGTDLSSPLPWGTNPHQFLPDLWWWVSGKWATEVHLEGGRGRGGGGYQSHWPLGHLIEGHCVWWCSECFEIKKIYICTILFRNGNLKLHLITMPLIFII